MNEAEAILYGLGVWSTVGAIVALVFLLIGIDRFDEDARGAYIFRPLLVPGVVIIWPLVLYRWFVLETGRDAWVKRHMPIRNAHTITAFLFAGLIVIIMIVGFSIRQTAPTDFAPQKLSSSSSELVLS